MPTQDINTPTVEPVFIMSKYLPDKIDVITMCRSAEAISGVGSVKGAYGDGGLWRIYPKTAVARALLLSKGITINRQRIQPESINPFILQGSDSEIPATRLSVGPLAFSYSDEFIIRNLESLGLRLRSKLVWENERFRDRTMSDWNNGKRFVWIDLPETPPKEFVNFGSAKVKLFYREMKEQRTRCYNCQQFGHRAADCPNDPVCFACGEVGHKKDDPICTHFSPPDPSPGQGYSDDQELQCQRCFEFGHHRLSCSNDVVCWDCKEKGHKRGDPICVVVQASARVGEASDFPPGGKADDAESDLDDNSSGDEGSEDDTAVEDDGSDGDVEVGDGNMIENDNDIGYPGADESSYEDAQDDHNQRPVSKTDERLSQEDNVHENSGNDVNTLKDGNILGGSQGLDVSHGTSSEGERYVIMEGEADVASSDHEKITNTTFTCPSSLDTAPGDTVDEMNSFSPSVGKDHKTHFPEYSSGEEEDAEADVPQESRPQRHRRKLRKSYAEAVSGEEDLSGAEDDLKKKNAARGKTVSKGGKTKTKAFSQVPITKFTEGLDDLKYVKRSVMASSPDGESKGFEGKYLKM